MGATPYRLIGDDGLLEVKFLPTLVKKRLTLEDYKIQWAFERMPIT